MNIVDYAMKFIGKPYIWGGNNAKGFDCSGLVIEVLQAFGILPQGDWTADGLSKKLQALGYNVVNDYCAGDIVFFKNSSKYYHVAIMVNDFQYIEAGGGGSTCTNADNSTGMIRLRTVKWRNPDLILRK